MEVRLRMGLREAAMKRREYICGGGIENGFTCGKPATVICVLMTRALPRCRKHEDDFISTVFQKVPIEEWVGA